MASSEDSDYLTNSDTDKIKYIHKIEYADENDVPDTDDHDDDDDIINNNTCLENVDMKDIISELGDKAEPYCINNINYNTLPWIEKYRPSQMSGVLSHDHIKKSLRNFMDKKYFPHLLLYGPPGSGKTSIIMACVKEFYGESMPFMVKELNASDDRGIDVVRNVIKHFVMAKTAFYEGKEENLFKMVILDETDAMTHDAQAILRKIVEKYNLTTRFCFICNYVQNIDPALQSRCTKFRFSPLDKKSIVQKVNDICSSEKIKVTDLGISTIIRRSSGDMRKIINTLQSTSMAYNIINEINVNKILGIPSKNLALKIIHTLINDNFKDAYYNVLQIKRENAYSVKDIIEEISCIFTDHLIEKKYPKLGIDINIITRAIDKMRVIEHNIALNTLDTVQISALVSAFKLSYNKTENKT